MEREKGSKKINLKPILIALSIPFLVAIGVISGLAFTGDSFGLINKDGKGADIAEVAEVTVILEEFLLNLEPSNSSNNYIRLELGISTKLENGEEKINQNITKIRDIVIRTVSRLKVTDIFDNEVGTDNLKKHLRTAINDEFEDDLIHEVYILNLVIQ